MVLGIFGLDDHTNHYIVYVEVYDYNYQWGR